MAGREESLRRGIWHVSREYAGIAEAGGLKDAVAGLAAAQARRGLPVAVVLPCYGFLDLERLGAEKLSCRFTLLLPAGNEASGLAEEEVGVHRLRRGGVDIFLLDTARAHGKRSVYTYTAEDEREDPYKKPGTGHWDAHHLNLTLQRGALELARCVRRLGWPGPPALFHCHDGHTGFLPAILAWNRTCRRHLKGCRALLTLHNAGAGYHQEIWGLEFAGQLTGLPRGVLEKGLCAEGRAVDPLLVGPRFAAVSTVSEQYAAEIVSGRWDELTAGLGAQYREAGIRLRGITNGIDPEPYDPRRPQSTGLAFAFDPGTGDWEGKWACRRWLSGQVAQAVASERQHPGYLQGRDPPAARGFSPGSPLTGLHCFGSLEEAGGGDPLFTFVGRLTGQKGIDLLAAAAARLLSRRVPVRFLVLGQGERALEERLAELALSPAGTGRFCLLSGFSGLAAKYIFAAGDFFLVPSLYEPCGLTDLYAQMMGNLPIVHRVGGLVKVRHGETGFSYEEHSADALCRAIEEAAEAYRLRPELLERMRRQAFQEVLSRYTWDRVLAEGYLPLYAEVLRGE